MEDTPNDIFEGLPPFPKYQKPSNDSVDYVTLYGIDRLMKGQAMEPNQILPHLFISNITTAASQILLAENQINNQSVLVHCYKGISRSGSLIIAYLIYKGRSFDQAFSYARSIRPQIQPNSSFMNQLYEFERRIRDSEDVEIRESGKQIRDEVNEELKSIALESAINSTFIERVHTSNELSMTTMSNGSMFELCELNSINQTDESQSLSSVFKVEESTIGQIRLHQKDDQIDLPVMLYKSVRLQSDSKQNALESEINSTPIEPNEYVFSYNSFSITQVDESKIAIEADEIIPTKYQSQLSEKSNQANESESTDENRRNEDVNQQNDSTRDLNQKTDNQEIVGTITTNLNEKRKKWIKKFDGIGLFRKSDRISKVDKKERQKNACLARSF
ncbi:6458_t:CDS:2 [Funneliformis geosporum]|uniref:protein-tyrosine-phosphatase n=1 Tax=Funneliformis geosporum TaxID=1117311 RepID=A0A9W4WIX9_9GLOM|nr:6458_t:CDS:2 [Funneliformis geosporum]